MIKILSIGQLPKEVGGNYTSGIARVVYELSRQYVKGVETYLYASNILLLCIFFKCFFAKNIIFFVNCQAHNYCYTCITRIHVSFCIALTILL